MASAACFAHAFLPASATGSLHPASDERSKKRKRDSPGVGDEVAGQDDEAPPRDGELEARSWVAYGPNIFNQYSTV